MDEFTETLAEIARELIARGFEPPLWLAIISLNGCTLTYRYDADHSTGGFSPTLLAENLSEDVMRLPINIMFVDSRGEATRVVIDPKGPRWVN